jgi:ribulose-phosphate 3-epimerase
MTMVKIAPSILSADFANLERDIRAVSSADYLHVDVMDGCFVPNLTIGIPVVKSIRKCTEMFLDVHLMIEKPVRYVEQFASAGADLLSVHLEADHPTRIAEALKLMEQCKVKKAVALRPITSANAVLPYLEELDMVLVMTVEPGFGGQAFMETQLDTIRQVRALIDRYNPACELEVDGGISPATAPRVVEAGANVLVAGSAVYGADDIPAAIQALRG